MARWWCVASTDPISLQRIVAASLLGLLTVSAFDPLLTERSLQGQLGWLAGMLVAVLALVAGLRRPGVRDPGVADRVKADASRRIATDGRTVQAVLGIDSSAALYLGPADAGTLEPVDTSGLGSWRVGPWQFVHFRGRPAGPRFLAFDSRRTEPLAWAALQRALVRARRRRARAPGAAGAASRAATHDASHAATQAVSHAAVHAAIDPASHAATDAARPTTDAERRPPRGAGDR